MQGHATKKNLRCRSCYRSYWLSAQSAVCAVPPADNVSQRKCLSTRTVSRGIVVEDCDHSVSPRDLTSGGCCMSVVTSNVHLTFFFFCGAANQRG
jgi:hypothetical protein